MPFGLTNAPATFQSLINTTLQKYVTGSQVLGYVGLLWAGTEWVVNCGTQDKGSKWIVFSLESYSLAGLLGVYIHIMSPGCSFPNGSDLSNLSALLDLS